MERGEDGDGKTRERVKREREISAYYIKIKIWVPIRWLFEERTENQCAETSVFITRHIQVCQKMSEANKVLMRG